MRKKRSLTLIEIACALGIFAVLTGVLFPHLVESQKHAKKIEKQRKWVLSKAHLYSGLSAIFAYTPQDTRFTIERTGSLPQLTFSRIDETTLKRRRGRLLVKEKNLVLETEPLSEEEEGTSELLFEGVDDLSFTCMVADGEKKKWEARSSGVENTPLFLKIKIRSNTGRKIKLFFHLMSNNYP
ncbi:MAG: type II secretion system protein [Simkaniaceae bacterium]|nr:type II secretion system protein [Simkaniaceae bacterium]